MGIFDDCILAGLNYFLFMQPYNFKELKHTIMKMFPSILQLDLVGILVLT